MARALASEILCPPAPRIVTPGTRFMRVAIIGLLPATIRDQYGFGWDAKQEVWLSLSARLVRTTLLMTPSILRHWPAARALYPSRTKEFTRNAAAWGGASALRRGCRR